MAGTASLELAHSAGCVKCVLLVLFPMEDVMVGCACRVDPVRDILRRDVKQDFSCYLRWRCAADRGSWREKEVCVVRQYSQGEGIVGGNLKGKYGDFKGI